MSVEAEVATLKEKCRKLEENNDLLFRKCDVLLEEVHKVSTNVAIMISIASVASPVVLLILESWTGK